MNPNPYRKALLTISLFAFLAAIIVALIAAANPYTYYPGDGTTQANTWTTPAFWWAFAVAMLGVVHFTIWLTLSASQSFMHIHRANEASSMADSQR